MKENDALAQAKKNIVTLGTSFGVAVGRYRPYVSYLGNSYTDSSKFISDRFNNKESMLFPIALLEGLHGVSRVMERLEPLLEERTEEGYRHELCQDLYKMREGIIRDRRNFLRDEFPSGHSRNFSDDEALTLLTPREEKMIKEVWDEAKAHPETKLLLESQGKTPCYDIDKPYTIIATPKTGGTVGGSAYLYVNTVMVHAQAETGKDEPKPAHSHYNSNREGNLLHENVHLLGQGHSHLFQQQNYKLHALRKQLRTRVEALADDEMKRIDEGKAVDFDKASQSLYSRWAKHTEPAVLSDNVEILEMELEAERAKYNRTGEKDIAREIALLEKKLQRAHERERENARHRHLTADDRAFIQKWDALCEKMDPALKDDGYYSTSQPLRKNWYLFRDMMTNLMCHVSEIEGKSYRYDRYQDQELAPRIVEFVRNYIPPREALCRTHPSLDLIEFLSPEVAGWYRDVWIPEMEKKLGKEAKDYAHIPAPLPTFKTTKEDLAPDSRVNATTLEQLAEIAKTPAGALMLTR